MTVRAISRIIVTKLFGSYDYDLKPSSDAVDPNRLIILYGDNGSGKTTILKALFHLLSPERRRGHKTALTTLPLAGVEVHFTTGDQVWMRRKEGQLVGGYTLGLRMAKRREKICECITREDGPVKASPKLVAFLQALSKLNIALYFLGDDRTIRLAGTDPTTRALSDGDDNRIERRTADDVSREMEQRRFRLDPERQAQHLLILSLRNTEQWIQSQAVRASAEGESSVNALYGEILSRIARVPLRAEPVAKENMATLERRIFTLEDRSKTYATYGLLPEFRGSEILTIVKTVKPSHEVLVSSVLTPYLDSVEKKLDAMESLQRQIDALVVLINSFYTQKRLSYEIHQGFRIVTDDDKELQPEMLSSGERHLLLLFCNAFQALDRPSIFIIDEPEISLNIKWQRRLLPALRECAGNNSVQYIFATHSFEILAQCQKNAIKLNSATEQNDGLSKDA